VNTVNIAADLFMSALQLPPAPNFGDFFAAVIVVAEVFVPYRYASFTLVVSVSAISRYSLPMLTAWWAVTSFSSI
jgi:hypothetical protein